MLHEIYASSISCLSNSRATVRGCGSGVMVRRQLVKLALLIKLLLDTPVRGEYSPAVFVIFVIGAYSDSPGPGLRVTAVASMVSGYLYRFALLMA